MPRYECSPSDLEVYEKLIEFLNENLPAFLPPEDDDGPLDPEAFRASGFCIFVPVLNMAEGSDEDRWFSTYHGLPLTQAIGMAHVFAQGDA